MRMTRRQFAGAVSGAFLGGRAEAQASKPNVIIIFCDDLGYSDLGCYGNRVIQTPRLDRLASEGARFTDFHVTSPVCSPSRAALITGQYQERYGIDHADLPESTVRYRLPPEAVTIAKVLKSAGYYTAHVGKWHLGEPPEAPHPLDQGFDYFFGNFGGRPSSGWIKYARSMDPEMIEGKQRPREHQGHVTNVQTEAALRVLKENAGKPFFLNLWFNAPHEPLAPIPHQDKLYKDWSSEEQTYFQTVSDVDAAVGRVLDTVEQLGLASNTLIFFSSDNGPETHRSKYSRGSAWPLKGMKTQLWEGGIRVPCLLRWPGKVRAGSVSDAIGSTLDVFPTIAAAAGASLPKGLELDGGVDLTQLLRKPAMVENRSLFFEFKAQQRGVEPSLPLAVRKGRWKLFASADFAQTQLYDLRAELGETTDVAGRHAEVAGPLLAELKAWKKKFPSTPDRPGQRIEPPSWEELSKRYYHN